MGYREIYIHSKLMIIDDVFLTVGSANLNQRSMSSDSEINVGLTGLKFVAPLWRRISDMQLGEEGSDVELPEFFKNWEGRMGDNRAIWKEGRAPLTGFLLPFEDHRSTATMHASITLPSAQDTVQT
jgi:phospholipase D1/2